MSVALGGCNYWELKTKENHVMRKVLLLAVLVLVADDGLFAQGGQASGKGPLRKLDQQIGIAKDLIRLFPDAKAEDLLRQAVGLREEAVALLASRRVVQATAKIAVALGLVERAINFLSQTPMDRIREQVDELIRRAEQLMPGSGEKQAERLLRQAKENVQTANRAARASNFRKAVEHFRVAKFLAERCLNLVDRPEGNLQERLLTERRRFEELLQRAVQAASTCQNQNAGKLVLQARKQAHGIEQSLNRGDLRLALNLYYNTTRLLLRAIDICEGRESSSREQAIEEIELLNDMIDTARGGDGQAADRRSVIILEKATRLQNQAQEAVERENFELALVKVELARNLISRLWEIPHTSYQERAEQELSRLQAEIEKLRNEQSSAGSEKAKSLLRAAAMSANDAERYLAHGRIRLALEAILAGNRFIAALQSAHLSGKAVNEQILSDGIARLTDELSQLSSLADLSEENLDIVEAAQQMLNRAQQSMAQGNPELALEYVKLGLDLVEKVKADIR